MEVEEENTANHLQESTTRTVSNESSLENKSMNDTELELEVPNSNTQEEQIENSSVLSPKLEDPSPFDAVAVGETAEEKEVSVECGNSEQTGGCWKSVVVEPTGLLKDEKDGAEVAANDGISTFDVAATECGGGELTNSTKLDVGECEAAVIARDNSLDVKVEEAGEALEEGGEVDAPLLPVVEIGAREEMMADVKSDGAEIVVGDEAITDGQANVQGVDAEVLADEEEGHDIGKAIEEEGKIEDEEKAIGVTENDEEEPTMADEEKSLDTELETDEEATMADEEKLQTEEMETELPESVVKGGRGKRKRGKNSKAATPKSTVSRKKIIEEDVCFICFDGGDLVLCDLRTCPKAYHPSCVNRDAAFFQTKGKWNCGWHLCSTCEKKAEYMCYTCTFSLCKACIKTNVILCLKEKEKKGFCESCMKTIMLIEKNPQENQGNIDFNDKNSWEYLFKDYWTDTKAKLNISLPDLLEAKNAWKGFGLAGKQEPPAVHSEGGGSGSENPSVNLQTKKKRIRKPKKQTKEDLKNTEWASKELLEFVAHMTAGGTSCQSQFDVQALLLEYIKTNRLRDSRQKSYIICDARLERLFGKPRVGHFEMLKLLESHFLVKEDSQMDEIDGLVEDDEGDEIVKSGKDKKRKIRKKVDREPQSNREDYAAIDTHNISLIYMKRKLAEDLLKDSETFCKKVVGTFVRIRIPGANNKNDIYRLVQVTGTTKTEEYSVGKQKTDFMLEILNLDKTESVAIDTISNQEFTEDECKRLRQSIKCGLINRLKVGDILDKAMELQAARVDDWLETEVVRLSHLRDRANDLGRKKEYPFFFNIYTFHIILECVEKLQILKTPEDRARRLQDVPVIHDDPTMDPNHVSEDDSDKDDKKQDMYKSSAGPRFNRRQPWSGTSTSKSPQKNYEFTPSNSFSNKIENLRKNEDSPSRKYIISETAPKTHQLDKMWHYKDPSGKIQGPFSMVQLRKWNNSKFFPVDLKIWKKSEKEDDGVILTDALEGRFTPIKWAPKHDERDGFGSLPSPTPNQSVPGSFHGGNEGLQSPTPSGPRLAAFGGGNNIPPQIIQPVVEQAYSPWGGVETTMVQNPAGNFLPPPAPVNLSPPPPPTQQPNVSWRPPGNQNMNWGPSVQSPQLTVTVNVNSPWGGGWAGPPAQGWITGPAQGNGNPNWAGPPNPSEVNTTPGWVGGPGNSDMGWGPSNQGWSSPTPRNRGMWDRSEQQQHQHQNYNRSGFSGQKRGALTSALSVSQD
ncbi:hypothetical protein L2E82_42651 [Cichorium intybus]|uniref:Uncharacterized protein n=1 Tax=Cichorium intybus TaxID=13427 RepID=A0ACB8ZLF0_CICIN|nr:hypothetical protein L2E82_42651 [Cichorium intybus]